MTATMIPSMIVEDVELRSQPSLLTTLVDPMDCGHLWEPHLWETGHAYCPRCGSRARWINDPRAGGSCVVTTAEHSVTQIVVLDVESTGKERATDQIIELCLRFGLGQDAAFRTWRIRPEVPIHPEATSVHGITMEDVAACPLFTEAAAEFLPLITGAHLIVGYNVAFDLDMLQAEMSRAKMPPLDLTGKLVVDVLRLWHHVEPRTLVAAHAKFCGEELVNAHQAEADVAATARVLAAMLSTFGLSDKPWAEIAAISDPFAKRVTWLGPSNHIQWDESGAVVFGFGKYKGQQVAHADAGFLKWVLAKDFPPHVKKICEVVLTRRPKFGEWIETYYPRPTAKDAAQDAPQDPFSDSVQDASQDPFSDSVQEVLL